MIRELDHLNDMTVRGLTGDHHAMGCKIIAVMVVDLKAVSVTLIDQFCYFCKRRNYDSGLCR